MLVSFLVSFYKPAMPKVMSSFRAMFLVLIDSIIQELSNTKERLGQRILLNRWT